MSIYFGILGGAILVTLCAIIGVGVANRSRFGRVFGGQRVIGHGGPYRLREVRTTHERGVPKTVWLASASAATWGVLTVLLFAPAGFVLSLILFAGGGAAIVAGFVLVALCLSGLGLGSALCVRAGSLAKRDASQVEGLVRWNLAHHVLVFLLFLVLGASTSGFEGFLVAFFMVGAACFLGVLQAVAISAAKTRLAAIEAEEDQGLALPAQAHPTQRLLA